MTQTLKCPACRKKHKGPPVAKLPANFTVLNLATSHKHRKSSSEVCLKHGDHIGLWCRLCNIPLCGQCLFENHMTHGYQVIKMQDVIREKKQKIAEQTTTILRHIDKEREALTREVHEIAHQLARLYKKSTDLNNHAKDANKILKNVRKTTRIKSILANQNSLENLFAEMNISFGDEKGDRTSKDLDSNSLVVARRRSHIDKVIGWQEVPNQDNRDSNKNNLEQLDIECKKSVSSSASNQTFDNSVNEILSATKNDQDLDSEKANQVCRKVRKDGKECFTSDSDSVEQDGDDGLESETSSETKVKGRDIPKWNLKCAPGGSSVWPCIDWQDFYKQLPAVQLLVPLDRPEVIMMLSVGTKSLGRVHIRLWGHLRRAQHFLALCLGTFGATYKGSRFTNVARKGLAGESLVGGRYLTARGSSSAGLLSDLEWRGKFSGPVTEGVLGGASDGDASSEALFGICTKGYPEGEYYCPFGEVLSGLEVVRAAVSHTPVTEVTIADIVLVSNEPKKPHH
ncbi:uncharacterized protein LOC122248367 [Penaeus japonicus]|uniref:uncharacterized protein LOC122248367 n=1 Tax=Penaeus japonicus TaxID=27405 RepID=UPI001C70E220|nr:uncharacterized protein LOC122248367 [Penaeus japonicus]